MGAARGWNVLFDYDQVHIYRSRVYLLFCYNPPLRTLPPFVDTVPNASINPFKSRPRTCIHIPHSASPSNPERSVLHRPSSPTSIFPEPAQRCLMTKLYSHFASPCTQSAPVVQPTGSLVPPSGSVEEYRQSAYNSFNGNNQCNVIGLTILKPYSPFPTIPPSSPNPIPADVDPTTSSP
jgi:hypothetical protein